MKLTFDFANLNDTEKILKLAEKVKENFPGFDENEFRDSLIGFIKRNEAVCSLCDGKAAGLLLFSKKDKELEFLAVDPDFRRLGIAQKMFLKMISLFCRGDVIKVITYREGDKYGTAALSFYKKMGFKKSSLTTAFGYPCMILKYTVK